MPNFRHNPVAATGAHYVYSEDAGRNVCMAHSELDAKMIAQACEEMVARAAAAKALDRNSRPIPSDLAGIIKAEQSSATPESDAAAMQVWVHADRNTQFPMIHLAFAQRLERERNEARAALEELKHRRPPFDSMNLHDP